MLQSGQHGFQDLLPAYHRAASSVFANLVDFLICFHHPHWDDVFYKITPTVNILWLPLFLLLAMITAMGVGLWFSALLVMYRDVNYLIAFHYRNLEVHFTGCLFSQP